MIVPDTWNTLSEFVSWYVENNYPIRVPENARVYPTDVSYSCCVFRQDVYQVELYLAKPNFTSTKHYHPFEQQIIFLGGHMWGKRGNAVSESPIVHLGKPLSSEMSSEMPSADSNKISGLLPTIHWHEVSAGEQGFIFFNCQKWQSKDLMDSAVVSYNGDSLGELHDKIIRK